jgi:hypothetical protein
MLPPKLHADLQKEFDFTLEFHDSNALFHPLDEGRILIHLPPPVKQGVPELLINKSLTSKAELVVLFMPADTSTEWFAKAFAATDSARVEIRFIQGRVKYTVSGKVKRVPSCIIVFRGDAYITKLHEDYVQRLAAHKYGNSPNALQFADRRSG